MIKILVSRCLLGEKCRYDGKSNMDISQFLVEKGYCPVGVCPEQLGGLSTPRVSAEIVGDRVVNKNSKDVTEQFVAGAGKTAKIGMENGCKIAVLKSKSPSCGCGEIYDGTFSGKKIKGDGVTAKLLLEMGYEIFTEKQIDML